MDSSSALQLLFKAVPVDPVTATVLKTFHRIYELHSQIQAVDEQTKDLLSTTHHVASNVQEARRLHRAKTSFLDYSENIWMENVIKDTEDALLAVAQLIEPIRVNRMVKKDIDFANKVEWVFKQNAQVAGKQARLNTCCQSLNSVIACLHSKNAGAPTTISGEQLPAYDFSMQRFLTWENQRKRRKSIMSSNSEDQDRRSRSSRSCSTTTDIASTSSSASIPPMDPRGSTFTLPETLEDSSSGTWVDPSKSYGHASARMRPASDFFPRNHRCKFARSLSVLSWPEVEEESLLSTFKESDCNSNPTPDSQSLQIGFDFPSTPSDLSPSVDSHPPAIRTDLESYYDGMDGLQVYDPYTPYSIPQIKDESLRPTIVDPCEIDAPSMLPYPEDDAPKSPEYTSSSMPNPHTYRPHTNESNPPRRPSLTTTLSMPNSQNYRRHTSGLRPSLRPVASEGRQSLENLRTQSNSYRPHTCQDGAIEDLSGRMASTTIEERRPFIASSGRGRRGWLAYHASRSDRGLRSAMG